MIFREAKLEDLPQLLKLEQGVVEAERPYNSAIKSEGASYYDIPYLIEDEQSYMLVLEHEGEIIATGYSQIRTSKKSLKHDQHAYLGFMFVVAEHRGKGINKQLMEKLLDWSQQQGIDDFYLDVYAQNQSAIKAYEKLGFAPCLVEMRLSR